MSLYEQGVSAAGQVLACLVRSDKPLDVLIDEDNYVEQAQEMTGAVEDRGQAGRGSAFANKTSAGEGGEGKHFDFDFDFDFDFILVLDALTSIDRSMVGRTRLLLCWGAGKWIAIRGARYCCSSRLPSHRHSTARERRNRLRGAAQRAFARGHSGAGLGARACAVFGEVALNRGKEGGEENKTNQDSHTHPLVYFLFTFFFSIIYSSGDRYSARVREYRYFLSPEPDLNIADMQTAAQFFVGSHDFRNLCRAVDGSDASQSQSQSQSSFRRVIYKACFVREDGGGEGPTQGHCGLYFNVVGSSFLLHQVIDTRAASLRLLKQQQEE